MRSPRGWSFALSIASFAYVLPAYAEPSSSEKAMATQLYDDAEKEIGRSNFATACSKFAESERLDPQLGTLLHLADCYEKAGKTASAWASFKDAIEIAARKTAAGVSEPRERIARMRASALEPKLSRLSVTVANPDTPGLEVRQDGQEVGRAILGSALPVDPGPHTVIAKAPGKKTWTKTIDVGSGARIDVAIPALEAEATASAMPAPLPVEPSNPMTLRHETSTETTPSGGSRRTIGFVVGGLGIVGVALGTVFTLKRGSTLSERDKLCPNDVCKDQSEANQVADLTDQAKQQTTSSLIGFGVGGAALVAGAVIVLTAPSGKSAASIGLAPWVAPTSAGAVLAARF